MDFEKYLHTTKKFVRAPNFKVRVKEITNTTEGILSRNSFVVKNANISPDQQRQIDLATEQFKQSVQRVDNQILNQYVQAVQNGDYAEAEAILKNAEESQQTNTLMFALLTIGVILLPLYAKQRIQNLLLQFGLHTVFAQTDSAQKALRQQAEKGAKSHVHTIAQDLKHNLDDAIDSELTNPDIEAQVKDKFEDLVGKDSKAYVAAVHKDENIYKYARDLILAGESRNNVIKKLQENFSEVGKRRAKVIAGNESNRVFTLSQFDADAQFLAQNKLTDKAYKRLVSNTGHPEAICKAIIEATAIKPIPFKQDFVPFGKVFTTKGDNGKTYKFTPNYEHLKSGHIHVNCHCRYELLIQRDDGTFFNSNTGRVENEADWVPDLHPRDKDGKFSKKGGFTKKLDFSDVTHVPGFNAYLYDIQDSGDYPVPSRDELVAVRKYQGHAYEAINLHARANQLDDKFSIDGEDTTYGAVIDRINSTAQYSLAKDTMLYRGTDIPMHTNHDVGDTVRSRSFLSTSVIKGVSEENFKAPGGSLVIISAKKGQRVIVPDLVTLDEHMPMGEAEILIPTGSALKITRIDGDVVYAELN